METNLKSILNSKGIVILILLGVTMLFSCKNDIETINLITSKTNFPDQSAENIEIIYSDSAKIKLKIIAPVLDHYGDKEEPYTEFPKGIDVTFYNPDRSIKSTLTANYAILDEKTALWEAKDDVVVVNKEEDNQLNTEHLIWDQNEGIIYSEKHVRITTADRVILGTGFESNQEFTKWTVKKIKGTLNFKDE